MNFERKISPTESMNIGAAKLALPVKRIVFSIYANDYRDMKPHELVDLINLWNSMEYQKAPDFAKNLQPYNVLLDIGPGLSHFAHAQVKLTLLAGEWLKLKDGKVIEVPKHLR